MRAPKAAHYQRTDVVAGYDAVRFGSPGGRYPGERELDAVLTAAAAPRCGPALRTLAGPGRARANSGDVRGRCQTGARACWTDQARVQRVRPRSINRHTRVAAAPARARRGRDQSSMTATMKGSATIKSMT